MGPGRRRGLNWDRMACQGRANRAEARHQDRRHLSAQADRFRQTRRGSKHSKTRLGGAATRTSKDRSALFWREAETQNLRVDPYLTISANWDHKTGKGSSTYRC